VNDFVELSEGDEIVERKDPEKELAAYNSGVELVGSLVLDCGHGLGCVASELGIIDVGHFALCVVDESEYSYDVEIKITPRLPGSKIGGLPEGVASAVVEG
jgi:hypothetical protein